MPGLILVEDTCFNKIMQTILEGFLERLEVRAINDLVCAEGVELGTIRTAGRIGASILASATSSCARAEAHHGQHIAEANARFSHTAM